MNKETKEKVGINDYLFLSYILEIVLKRNVIQYNIYNNRSNNLLMSV